MYAQMDTTLYIVPYDYVDSLYTCIGNMFVWLTINWALQ